MTTPQEVKDQQKASAEAEKARKEAAEREQAQQEADQKAMEEQAKALQAESDRIEAERAAQAKRASAVAVVPPTPSTSGATPQPGSGVPARLPDGTVPASGITPPVPSRVLSRAPTADRRGAATDWQTETQAEVNVDADGTISSTPTRLEGGTAVEDASNPQGGGGGKGAKGLATPANKAKGGEPQAEGIELPEAFTLTSNFDRRRAAIVADLKRRFDDPETIIDYLARQVAVSEAFIGRAVRENGGFLRATQNDVQWNRSAGYPVAIPVAPADDTEFFIDAR